ncbi:MAG: hypothetical protein FWG63_01355 [Defluviitaleaceae bacterium]|nr:hypothetical protein [Defluviitaleaceae bacterium]
MTQNTKKLIKLDVVDTCKHLLTLLPVLLVVSTFLMFVDLAIFNEHLNVLYSVGPEIFWIFYFWGIVGFATFGSLSSGIDYAINISAFVQRGVTRKEIMIARVIGLGIFNVVGVVLISVAYNFYFIELSFTTVAALLTLGTWVFYFLGFIPTIVFVRFHPIIGAVIIFLVFSTGISIWRISALTYYNFLERGNISAQMWGAGAFVVVILGAIAWVLCKNMPIKTK